MLFGGTGKREIGICRIPGHCEPVRFPGVAISWIGVQFLVDECQKTVQKNGLYDDGLPEIRWRFPHQSEDWFGMTVLFDTPAFLCKFPIYLCDKKPRGRVPFP